LRPELPALNRTAMNEKRIVRRLIRKLTAKPGARIKLADHDPGYTAKIVSKEQADELLNRYTQDLVNLQDMLYAQDRYAVLIIFQALDAAGKDSTIKHVMSGINPQGCQVTSFKQPSAEELDHTYLWRSIKALPARGMIGIHNRSYYEEVLAVRVHPEYLTAQHLPPECLGKNIWKRRFKQINAFEKYLVQNGTRVIKFFLHVSKEEQKERFLERIDKAEKNWKFSLADVHERQHWDAYQEAYEEVFNATSTRWAPWYIVPANHKWFMRLAVNRIINRALEKLDLHYPIVSEERKQQLENARQMLAQEP
jgi:PPK2 family polyphosphate:nucleotide phosphotransferase